MKRRHPYCLARAYVDLGAHGQALFVFDLLHSVTSARAVTAEVNYEAQRSLEAARACLKKSNDVEQILALDSDGEVAFAVTREPREGGNCVSLVACWPAGDAYTAPRKLFVALDGALRVAYGYARIVPRDVSPISEAPVRKRWFGYSVSVPKHREGWLSPSQSVLAGGVRGIYALNYWHPTVHEQFQALGVQLPPGFGSKAGLVEVDAEAARAIRSLNPGSPAWLHDEGET